MIYEKVHTKPSNICKMLKHRYRLTIHIYLNSKFWQVQGWKDK